MPVTLLALVVGSPRAVFHHAFTWHLILPVVLEELLLLVLVGGSKVVVVEPMGSLLEFGPLLTVFELLHMHSTQALHLLLLATLYLTSPQHRPAHKQNLYVLSLPAVRGFQAKGFEPIIHILSLP